MILDGTFGAGGYSRALLEASGCRVLGVDRDPSARAAGEALAADFPDRFSLTQARFSELADVARAGGHNDLDGVVLDIGVSSMQLDQAGRGFSFQKDGPLDMRMSAEGPSAADVVSQLNADELANVFFRYGEERASRRIAAAIVRERQTQAITTTGRLAEIVAKVSPGKPGTHPPRDARVSGVAHLCE